jgi:hypothetical protein
MQLTNGFSLQNTCGSIAPQSSCILDVTFNPVSASAYSGVLILKDNAGSSPGGLSEWDHIAITEHHVSGSFEPGLRRGALHGYGNA